jgi:hypothetical protein
VVADVCIDTTTSMTLSVAPCHTEFSLQLLTTSAQCGSVTGSANTTAGRSVSWTPLPIGHSTINIDDLMATTVNSGVFAPQQYQLMTRPVDAAGNVGDIQSTTWWVDVVRPLFPTIVSAPSPVSTETTATFEFRLTEDSSPGQVSFVYSLTVQNGSEITLPGGNPPIPNPTPTNLSPVTLTLVGLSTNAVYNITVRAVDQSGLMGVSAQSFVWQTVVSAPSVLVLRQPSVASGSKHPAFTFAADWGAMTPLAGVNVSFEVQLLGDVNLGSFHQPPVCNATADGLRIPVPGYDCVDAGCGQSGCNYTLFLQRPQANTLQVDAVAFQINR